VRARRLRPLALLSVAALVLAATGSMLAGALRPTPAAAKNPAGVSAGLNVPGDSWLRQPCFIAHALGGLTVGAPGKQVVYTYTNCREAFEQNYAKGYRVFEVDLIPTRNGGLVARHDWSAALFRALGQKVPSMVPRTSDFLATKILGKYTPLSIDDVIGLMRAHPDIYVITDTKYPDWPHVSMQFREIVRAMGKDAPALSQRLVVQIYEENMLGFVRRVYPFPNIIYTLYRQSASLQRLQEAAKFARNHGIGVITLDLPHYSASRVAMLRADGIAPCVNTVNSASQAAQMFAQGVRFIQSDNQPGAPGLSAAGLAGGAKATPPLAPSAVPFDPRND
jgi:glycerophosphoryl diester phosphodiesterase